LELKMNKPLVSIVTITYNLIKNNRKDFFIQCVNSVREQTYNNIEHIIIDGASDDGTLELIEPFEKEGSVKYYSEPDDGIYYAMNKGIQKASGEYILFLNSDDFFIDEKGIEASVDCILENNADFSYAKCTCLDLNDKVMGTLDPVVGAFMLRMPFSHQTLLLKRTKMLELNLFDTNYKSAGDFDLVLRLFLSAAKSVEVNLNFVAYRLGGLSNTDVEQSDRECIAILEKNYSKYIDADVQEYTKMFYKMLIPKKLFEKFKNSVSSEIKNSMEEIVNLHSEDRGEYYFLKKHATILSPKVERDVKFLGISILKTIKCYYRTKIIILGFIKISKKAKTRIIASS